MLDTIRNSVRKAADLVSCMALRHIGQKDAIKDTIYMESPS